MRYGIIGNCKTAALVHETGSIDWCCMPSFDHPSVFARLLDEDGGHFCIRMPGSVQVRQRYLPRTNLLETIFENGAGAFAILDYMPRFLEGGDYCHPPEIHRMIRPIRGKPFVQVDFSPKLNYALGETMIEIHPDYLRAHQGLEDVYLYSSIPLDTILEKKEFALEKEEFFLLSYHELLRVPCLEKIRVIFERTQKYWEHWAARCVLPSLAPEAVLRSALTLKLMTYEASGAIIAAPTTSLPEALGEGRNWDYRYCWLRDASLLLEALKSIGHFEEAKSFIHFLLRILESKQTKVQIAYGIDGRTQLDEKFLPHLRGYKGSAPVRVGNQAAKMKQNDIFGEILNTFYEYYFHYHFEEINNEVWSLSKFLVNTIAGEWASEDAGIWEYRHRLAHFSFSKLLSWVALDRGSKMAEQLGKDSLALDWRRTADTIRQDVLDKGWNPVLNSFTQSYGSFDLDVSILKMCSYGFLEDQDPRWIATVRLCAQNLLQNDCGFRYTAPDDFGKPKSSFILATFWIAKALHTIGEKDWAMRLFETILSRSNHLGLLSEDIDPYTGELLGNFPQAFSHMALINTANVLAKG